MRTTLTLDDGLAAALKAAALGFLPGVDPLKLTQLIDEFDVYWFMEQSDGATPDADS